MASLHAIPRNLRRRVMGVEYHRHVRRQFRSREVLGCKYSVRVTEELLPFTILYLWQTFGNIFKNNGYFSQEFRFGNVWQKRERHIWHWQSNLTNLPNYFDNIGERAREQRLTNIWQHFINISLAILEQFGQYWIFYRKKRTLWVFSGGFMVFLLDSKGALRIL